jgi:hypothetical protein
MIIPGALSVLKEPLVTPLQIESISKMCIGVEGCCESTQNAYLSRQDAAPKNFIDSLWYYLCAFQEASTKADKMERACFT